MVKYKSIRLEPSEWELDVYVSSNKKELAKVFARKYGASEDYYKTNILHHDFVVRLSPTKLSECGLGDRIIMKLNSMNPAIMVHELIHVLHHSANATGMEISYETQEWQALFVERLFNEVRKNNYEKIQ